MTKERLEQILVEYGVSFTDNLADRLLKEFEPCEDVHDKDVGNMIDRRAAKDDAHRQLWYRMNPSMKERIDEWLDSLPSASPARLTGWIPVSEKPPVGMKVLLCFNDGFQMLGFWIQYEDDSEPVWDIVGDTEYVCDQKDIVAWQPLPQGFEENEG